MTRAQADLHTWRLKQQAEVFHLGVAALAAAAFLATFLKKVCVFSAACLAFALMSPYMYSCGVTCCIRT